MTRPCHQAGLRAGETVAAVATGGVESKIMELAKAFGGPTVVAIDDGWELTLILRTTHK
jgi:hypothetical protein